MTFAYIKGKLDLADCLLILVVLHVPVKFNLKFYAVKSIGVGLGIGWAVSLVAVSY